MNRFGARHLVYSSSATVYGAPKTIPIPETTPLAPESCYGRTKAMSEWIIKDVADSDPSWRTIALRYFNPAGAHPSGMIGEDPRGKPGNLLPLLAQMAVGKFAEEGLKIFGNDYPTHDGTCVVSCLCSVGIEN
jgi:UDP-glucose 4-epimerase